MAVSSNPAGVTSDGRDAIMMMTFGGHDRRPVFGDMSDSLTPPRFLCDAMLGSLCRWLRFFGLDSEFAGVEATDAEIGARAAVEERWLLTSDRELASRGPRTMLVRSIELEDQLVEVLGRLRLAVRPDLENSRCSHCNGLLTPQQKNDVVGDVPPFVLKTASRFKRCGLCRRVFWPGTHGEKILARMGRVADRVNPPVATHGLGSGPQLP